MKPLYNRVMECGKKFRAVRMHSLFHDVLFSCPKPTELTLSSLMMVTAVKPRIDLYNLTMHFQVFQAFQALNGRDCIATVTRKRFVPIFLEQKDGVLLSGK